MVVLDPMLGSGPGASVAKSLGQKFVGYDLNEEWVNLSAARVNLEDGKVRNSYRRPDELLERWEVDESRKMRGT